AIRCRHPAVEALSLAERAREFRRKQRIAPGETASALHDAGNRRAGVMCRAVRPRPEVRLVRLPFSPAPGGSSGRKYGRGVFRLTPPNPPKKICSTPPMSPRPDRIGAMPHHSCAASHASWRSFYIAARWKLGPWPVLRFLSRPEQTHNYRALLLACL